MKSKALFFLKELYSYTTKTGVDTSYLSFRGVLRFSLLAQASANYHLKHQHIASTREDARKISVLFFICFCHFLRISLHVLYSGPLS